MFYHGNDINSECVNGYNVVSNLECDINKGIKVYNGENEIAHIDICMIDKDVIKIAEIGVSKNNRGNGIGKYLIAQVLFWAERNGIESIQIKPDTYRSVEVAKSAKCMNQEQLEAFYNKFSFISKDKTTRKLTIT